MSYQKAFSFAIILSSFFLSIFNGCSDSVGPKDNTQKNTIPLKLGNSWEYQFISYDSTEAVSSTETNFEKVLNDTIISEAKWYSLYSSPKEVWFTNKSDGYWVFAKSNGHNNLNNDTTFLVYKNPALKGDKSGVFEVVELDVEVVVPAGTFKCIHLVQKFENSQNYLTDSFEVFITPGIGKIKWMQIGNKSENRKYIVYKSELVSYSLK